MAFLGNTFDPNDVAADERNFEPMPEGDYNVQIVESEVVGTKSGGDMLKLTLEVLDGQFANRKVWDNLNIRNANATAQNIAHQTLKSICDACGLGPIQDSEDLHFKPLVATLKIEPSRTVGDKTYDARNGVKRYKGRSGASSTPAGKAQPQRAAVPASRPAAQASRGWTPPSGRTQQPAIDDNIPF